MRRRLEFDDIKMGNDNCVIVDWKTLKVIFRARIPDKIANRKFKMHSSDTVLRSMSESPVSLPQLLRAPATLIRAFLKSLSVEQLVQLDKITSQALERDLISSNVYCTYVRQYNYVMAG